MSDNNTQERTIGQSIGYWTVVYLITIPVLSIVVGIIVRAALMSAA